MKKILALLTICIAFTLTLQAQIRKVPSEVTDAFKAKYPNAKNVEWKDKLTFFRADFKMGETDMTADFSNKGDWQETEKAMNFSEAPAAIREGLNKSKYASRTEWKPGDVVTMITKSDNSVMYRVYVDKVDGVQKKYLFFNTSGQLEKEALTL